MINCKCRNCDYEWRTQRGMFDTSCMACGYESVYEEDDTFTGAEDDDITSSAESTKSAFKQMEEQLMKLNDVASKNLRPALDGLARAIDKHFDSETPLYVPKDDTSLLDWMEKKK